MKLKGADVVAALENGVSKVEENQGRFPQVSSNLRYSWDPKKPAGSRIVSVEVKRNGSFQPLDPNAVYNVATNDFMRRGGDGYTVFKTNAVDAYDFGPNLEDSVAAYIAKNSPVQAKLEGRVRQP
jgi:5'-nucleotidase